MFIEKLRLAAMAAFIQSFKILNQYVTDKLILQCEWKIEEERQKKS